jgi:hypothetical protein
MDWDREIEAWREASEVPEAAVAELRARVLAGLDQPRTRLPYWKLALPAAALGMGAIVLWNRPEPVPPVKVAPKPAIHGAPLVEEAPPPSAPMVTQRARRRAPAQEASYIRLETADPDVVILLMGSDGGGE